MLLDGGLHNRPFVLTFAGEKEKEFQARYFQNSLNIFRIAFPTIIVLYAVFGYLDMTLVPEFTREFHIIRFYIVIPFLAIVFICSFFSFFERVWQWLLFLSFLVGGLGIIYMIVLAPHNFSYYLGLMLVFSAGYFFVKLSFFKATIGGWLLVLFFNIGIIYYTELPQYLIISINFFFVAANLINMLAAYYIEMINRRNFDLNHQLAKERKALEDINLTLEEKVVKRTKELKEKEESLRELNATKDRFFSIIAHDLRNPVGTFKLLAESMIEEYDTLTDQERIEFVQLMKNSSENVFLLLENLLEWSRSKQGNIVFEPSEVLLHTQADKTISLTQTAAVSKGVNIVNTIPKVLTVQADVSMLDTILRNLISNAIKYSNKGDEVTIHAETTEDAVIVSVKDTGVGIYEKHLAGLFTLDNDIRQTGTANERGTGLGLILCREFVNYHKGRIWVESQKGKGSTFYVSLPQKN